jgi:hypothetical protein
MPTDIRICACDSQSSAETKRHTQMLDLKTVKIADLPRNPGSAREAHRSLNAFIKECNPRSGVEDDEETGCDLVFRTRRDEIIAILKTAPAYSERTINGYVVHDAVWHASAIFPSLFSPEEFFIATLAIPPEDMETDDLHLGVGDGDLSLQVALGEDA